MVRCDRRIVHFVVMALLLPPVFGCARQSSATRHLPQKSAHRGHTEKGMASWYGPHFRGRRTASGARFNPNALTAAHRTLPFGTKVKVTNLENGNSVKVVINDRGPFVAQRIIDLSHAAARKLGMLGTGVARVQLKVMKEPS